MKLWRGNSNRRGAETQRENKNALSYSSTRKKLLICHFERSEARTKSNNLCRDKFIEGRTMRDAWILRLRSCLTPLKMDNVGGIRREKKPPNEWQENASSFFPTPLRFRGLLVVDEFGRPCRRNHRFGRGQS